jgi:ferredoxin
MRIDVDRDVCQGNGVCVAIAPEYFDLDEEGTVHLLVGDVPADSGIVATAVDSCPVQALRRRPEPGAGSPDGLR